MSTLIVYGIVALLVMGALASGVYKVHHDGYLAGKAECQKAWDDAVAAQKKSEESKIGNAVTEKGKADEKAKIVYRTITKTIEKDIERPIYRNLCLDSDGLQHANAALVGALTAARVPDKPVSKPDAAK